MHNHEDAGIFLNVKQTAEQLGVHTNTVRNLEKRGQLQAIHLPGSGVRRFRKEDVKRMRQEMWSQFAPDTSLPDISTHPTHPGIPIDHQTKETK